MKKYSCHRLKMTSILYTEDLKDAIKNLLKLINKFSEVAGYKINLQKSVVSYLY